MRKAFTTALLTAAIAALWVAFAQPASAGELCVNGEVRLVETHTCVDPDVADDLLGDVGDVVDDLLDDVGDLVDDLL